jgi:predicted small secreted protein
MLKPWFVRSVVVLTGLLLAACATEQGPAEQALKAAENAVNSAAAEAVKYVPDQVKTVQDQLKSLKDTYAKGDYKAVLGGASDLTAKVKALSAAAAAKKAELTKSWEDVNAGLPKVVDAIKRRVDILSKAKKLPATVDRAAVDAAQSGLQTLDKVWNDAQASFKSGNLADALAKAQTAKTQAADIMTKLGMDVPAALKT